MSNKLSKKDIEAYNRLTIPEGMQSIYYKGKVYTRGIIECKFIFFKLKVPSLDPVYKLLLKNLN